jgi:beta-N-acetylhexosaminidase
VLVVTPDPPRRTNAEGLEDNPVSGGLLAAIQRYAPAASDTPDGPADVIIVAAHDLAGSPDQQTRVAALAASGVPVILVSLRGPYAAAAVPTIGTVLAVYGDRRVHLQAAAEALFGAFTPTGIQP